MRAGRELAFVAFVPLAKGCIRAVELPLRGAAQLHLAPRRDPCVMHGPVFGSRSVRSEETAMSGTSHCCMRASGNGLHPRGAA